MSRRLGIQVGADPQALSWLFQLQVGVEFEASTRMQDTSVSFGYQLDLPKANLLFKGKSLKFPSIENRSK